MEKITDRQLDYRGENGSYSFCRLRIYEALNKPLLVLLTELPENPGMSVTNVIEVLAQTVYFLLERPTREILWIEHYPLYDNTEEHFDRVIFTKGAPPFRDPRWTPLTLSQVERWTGDPLIV